MSAEQYYEEIVTVPIDIKQKCDPYCLISIGTSLVSLIIVSIVWTSWYILDNPAHTQKNGSFLSLERI